VEDLSKLAVTSYNDIQDLMDSGNKARYVGWLVLLSHTLPSCPVLIALLASPHDKSVWWLPRG
jgi:hypothetical protein